MVRESISLEHVIDFRHKCIETTKNQLNLNVGGDAPIWWDRVLYFNSFNINNNNLPSTYLLLPKIFQL